MQQGIQEILNRKHSSGEAENKRKEISRNLISASDRINGKSIHTISTADLELLFGLYDRIFLDHWFHRYYRGNLRFSLSDRMTKSAGKTICRRDIHQTRPEEMVIEIRIGVDFLFQYDQIEGGKTVCGIRTSNSLEALQLVFEHELCHAVEFILFGKSSCAQQRFKTLANNLFGHMESYHRLPTYKQIASQKFGLQIGDVISFPFDGTELTGILYNINKRATVLVRDPEGALADKHGNRYTKFYVPLELLK
jgi:hypothetical protein